MTKKEECLKALQCLYLAVDASIADDVKRKVLEALDEANKNFVLADVSGSLPNDIDLLKLKSLLTFSDRYEISVQFWPQQTAVYIAKDGVDLTDFGGDFDFAIGKATEYLNRITGQ